MIRCVIFMASAGRYFSNRRPQILNKYKLTLQILVYEILCGFGSGLRGQSSQRKMKKAHWEQLRALEKPRVKHGANFQRLLRPL